MKIMILGLVLSLGAGYLLAWTGPSGIPPNADVAVPINVDTGEQAKGGPVLAGSLLDINGVLSANALAVFGNAVLVGNVRVSSLDSAHNPTATTWPAPLCVNTDNDLVICSCTFTYSDWGPCQRGNTQTRTATDSSPTGCAGSPVLSQGCTYVAPLASPPSVTTASVTGISDTNATTGGNVTSDGGANVTTRGVYWSTNAISIIAPPATKTTNGSGLGTFTSSLTGLTENTTYHVRAYATNSAGTAFGNDVTFTTATQVTLDVTTQPVTSITQTTATGNGTINFVGFGANAVTTKGIVWSTSSNPTTALSTKSATICPGPSYCSSGSFTRPMTGLQPNTQYHVRAYDVTVGGTVNYGNEVTFTTLP